MVCLIPIPVSPTSDPCLKFVALYVLWPPPPLVSIPPSLAPFLLGPSCALTPGTKGVDPGTGELPGEILS